MQELAIEGKIEKLTKYSNIHAHLNKLKEQYKQEITKLSPDILKQQKYIQTNIDKLTGLSKNYCKDGALEDQNNRIKQLIQQTKKREITTNKQINDILEKMKIRTIPDIDIFIKYADIQKDIKQLTQNINKFKRADEEESKETNKTVKKYHDELTKKYESLTKQSQELNNSMKTDILNTDKIPTLEKNIKNFNKETDFVSKETTKLSEQANKFNTENLTIKTALDKKIEEIKKRIDDWNESNSKFTNLSGKLKEFKDKNIEQEINTKYNKATKINDNIKKLNVDQIKEDNLKAIREILRIHEDITKQEFKHINQSKYRENINE